MSLSSDLLIINNEEEQFRAEPRPLSSTPNYGWEGESQPWQNLGLHMKAKEFFVNLFFTVSDADKLRMALDLVNKFKGIPVAILALAEEIVLYEML